MNLEIRTELQIPVLEEGAVIRQGRQQNITAVLARHGACPRLCARRGVNLDVLAQHIFDLDISKFRDPVKNPRGTVNRSEYVQVHRSTGVTGYLRLRRDKLRVFSVDVCILLALWLQAENRDTAKLGSIMFLYKRYIQGRTVLDCGLEV